VPSESPEFGVRVRFWQSSPEPKTEKPAGRSAGDVQLELAAIRQRFAKRLREDYAVLAPYRNDRVRPTHELVSVVHRLAGSAAMVGFAEIGEIAGRLDDALAEPGADVSALLNELLALLEKTISDS
jgi:HPt (histidine-containing phosphotransfer) domain-containing protein